MKNYKKTRAGFKVLNFRSRYNQDYTQQIGYYGKILVRPKKGTGFTKYKIVWFNALFDMNMKCVKIGDEYSGIAQNEHNLRQVDIVKEWDFEMDGAFPYNKQIAVEDFEEVSFDSSAFSLELYEAYYWRLEYLLKHFITAPYQHRKSQFLKDAREYAIRLLDKDRFIMHWLYAGKGPINVTKDDKNFLLFYRWWLRDDVSTRTVKKRLSALEKKRILKGVSVYKGKEYSLKTDLLDKKSKLLIAHWAK